jgi:hypothetical protein
MRPFAQAAFRIALTALGPAFLAVGAHAQLPVTVLDTAAPIIINTVKPHKTAPQPKFEGTVVNATILQITVRAKDNDMAVETFPLSEALSAKMIQIMEKGGYQYGDKVTVFYEVSSKKALKIKGKPSKAL